MKFKTNDDSINYQAEIVEIKDYKKHPNADKLFIININFNSIITGVEPTIGDLMVYFPIMSKINSEFLRYINAFDKPELNSNTEIKGFFTSKCRVKPIKLRGIPSEGYLHPVSDLNSFLKINLTKDDLGKTFNEINDVLVCDKYILTTKNSNISKKDKAVKKSRLVDNQFRLHIDTENLRKNVFKIKPEDLISLHYKKHGTSWIVGNVLTKPKVSWLKSKLIKWGISSPKPNEYDHVYASRKVIKNGYINSNPQHYYSYDLWQDIKDQLKDKIPKGFTLYGEAIGYTKDGGFIQKDYDYAAAKGTMRLFVYRITFTNEDGFKVELTDKQIEEFCEKYDLQYKSTFIYYGKAKDLYPELNTENHWHENFLRNLERDHTEKLCYMCKNNVPEEGIVLRKESLFEYEAYKLKSFKFLEKEDKELELGIENLEDNQI